MSKQLKESIVKYVGCLGRATFPQLLRLLESDGFEIRGGYSIGRSDVNIEHWGGLSEEVSQAIHELLKSEKIVAIPASIDAYEFEKVSFPLPVLAHYPTKKLNEPMIFLVYLAIPGRNNGQRSEPDSQNLKLEIPVH